MYPSQQATGTLKCVVANTLYYRYGIPGSCYQRAFNACQQQIKRFKQKQQYSTYEMSALTSAQGGEPCEEKEIRVTQRTDVLHTVVQTTVAYPGVYKPSAVRCSFHTLGTLHRQFSLAGV